MMRHLRKVMKASRGKECKCYQYTIWKDGDFMLTIKSRERRSKDDLLGILEQCVERMREEWKE